MTNDGFRLQILRQHLGHIPTKTAMLYVDTDTTAATQYAEGTAGMDNAQRDGEGEGTS
ncbi:hypothetical protein [Streptomyces sp. NPDC050988]|uniref:hypothetical protein n=1 Tax=Streptomyces sp. NPDC050988 TaxID=3365637 RepID=UPI00379E2E66